MLKIPPDWGTFCVLIVSFLVFWFIFKRLLFDPFLKLLADRERKLKGLRDRTEQLIREGLEAHERHAREITAVRREALAEREGERRRAEEEVGRMMEEARMAAKDSIEQVRVEIERELRAAEQQLGNLGENLAAELAERVLGRPLKGGGPRVHSPN
ncbi:MAG TPA: ATP synthase F0 subunit B [Candidatus Binataceae bacterium]|nr:ATP synthase F0 subunit B [Candidatus Binataceae bacterium]